MTGAELLAWGLRDAGVDLCFGLPGVHNLPLWDALREDSIRLVGVRHEQSAVYAADGYARASARTGVALVTTGPGAANALGALGEAWASRSPVVVVATDVPTEVRGRGMSLHAGADQAGMARPVTKAVLEVDATSTLRTTARHACELARAAPARPVWLQVPADLLRADAEAKGHLEVPEDRRRVDAGAAGDALARARRPLVWAGGGAVQDQGGEAVAALARHLGAPVLTSFAARGLVDDERVAVGLPPHLEEVGALWDRADAIVAVGSDLDGMNTQNWRQPQPPLLVTINVDPGDVASAYIPDHSLAAHAGDGCRALLAALGDRPDRPPWIELEDVRERAWGRLRLEHPQELGFLDAVAAVLPSESVVLADMCIAGYWLAAFGRVSGPRRLQYPMGWGTLGYAFPASLGAALAGRGPVVSFSGDGGFLFACGELATAAQERLPLTAVVVDDGGYGMLRFDQDRAGVPHAGVDLRAPDFAALAQAFDIHAESVDGVGAAFADALARHVADDEPSLLHVRARMQPPPSTSPRWYRAAAGDATARR